MAIKYFYIDDDPQSKNKVEGFYDADLSIETRQPENSWEEQIKFLKENDFDGLIIDLKLDDLPNAHNRRADFRGTSLAQEIRTRQKEGLLKPFPIILFSANDKTQKSLENTGIDLFDIFIDKSKLDDKEFLILTPRIIDIPNGYKVLLDNSLSLSEILKTDERQIDSRFISEFNENRKSPVHIQSRFLITELINKQGLLVDEQVLAARLGIDILKSDDWKELLKIISFAKYNGVFCKGWSRWWMYLIEQWWDECIKADSYLRSTPASVRVEKIKEFTKLDQLFAAEKIDKADSDEFWTICKGCCCPLDPVDGLLIQGQDNLYSWQEPEYVSIDAALKRRNIDKWINVADIESMRYNELKIVYKPKNK